MDLDDLYAWRGHQSGAGARTQPLTLYLLQVACPCGVTLAGWVTPEDAGAGPAPARVAD